MRATIDAAGRLVVPKPLRDELGFAAGTELELEIRDGHLEVTAHSVPMHLEERDGHFVIVPERPVPVMTADEVRDVLEQIRR